MDLRVFSCLAAYIAAPAAASSSQEERISGQPKTTSNARQRWTFFRRPFPEPMIFFGAVPPASRKLRYIPYSSCAIPFIKLCIRCTGVKLSMPMPLMLPRKLASCRVP